MVAFLSIYVLAEKTAVFIYSNSAKPHIWRAQLSDSASRQKFRIAQPCAYWLYFAAYQNVIKLCKSAVVSSVQEVNEP